MRDKSIKVLLILLYMKGLTTSSKNFLSWKYRKTFS